MCSMSAPPTSAANPPQPPGSPPTIPMSHRIIVARTPPIPVASRTDTVAIRNLSKMSKPTLLRLAGYRPWRRIRICPQKMLSAPVLRAGCRPRQTPTSSRSALRKSLTATTRTPCAAPGNKPGRGVRSIVTMLAPLEPNCTMTAQMDELLNNAPPTPSWANDTCNHYRFNHRYDAAYCKRCGKNACDS